MVEDRWGGMRRLNSDKKQSKQGRLELLCDNGGRTRTTTSKLQATSEISKEDLRGNKNSERTWKGSKHPNTENIPETKIQSIWDSTSLGWVFIVT